MPPRGGAPLVPWLVLQQLLDSALPIGGFSHSFGLETLVQEGDIARPDELEAYLRAMLRQSWTTTDALVVRAVYRDAPVEAWERLWAAERLVHVGRMSAETRSGMEKMGRRLLKLAGSSYPELDLARLEAAYRSGDCLLTHPLVFGWICWQAGIGEEQALQGWLYGCLSNAVNSALRLMAIGQTEAQRLLALLSGETVPAARAALAMEPEDAWSDMPGSELGMIRHETLYSRLFMS
ncbi:urease accessory protein UreF [Paenibacillus sp. B01]|uniref:urease accessory protein UreF n=1 Tax=Paenibacillus sp. B01 TaxID=2660554 RepID=UPI00129A11DF|nr:urease accessory UreF family protein [Paenibacillus sp. B01]QGG57200.1 urease accessory protein UreF [Paenibacillus sp. B01]